MSEAVQTHKVDKEKQTITLSVAALTHVKQALKKRGSGIGLRLGIKKTGCSGLAYVVDYVDHSNADDLVFPQDEVLSVFVDNNSFPYVQGTQIDYVKQGVNAQFKFYNPNETAACGCGESFTVE